MNINRQQFIGELRDLMNKCTPEPEYIPIKKIDKMTNDLTKIANLELQNQEAMDINWGRKMKWYEESDGNCLLQYNIRVENEDVYIMNKLIDWNSKEDMELVFRTKRVMDVMK